jgi:uncharacterized protein YabE (DUF348 family)
MRKAMKKVKSKWVVCALALGVLAGVSTSLTTEEAYAATKIEYGSTLGNIGQASAQKVASAAKVEAKIADKTTGTGSASVDASVKNGTKIASTAKTVTRKDVKPTKVDYVTQYIYDANLKPGEEKVVTPGRTGLELNIYTVTTVRGKETSRVLTYSRVIVTAKDRVVRTGTKQGVTTEVREEVETTAIPYTVEYVENAELPVGEEVVSIVGKDGTSTKTYSNTYVDGELTESVLVNDEVVAPVTQVVEKGTLVVTYVDRTETEVTPFETRYVENSSLEVGTEVVTQEGQAGETVHTYVDTVINGEVTESSYKGATVITEVVDQVIEQGTKTTTEETRTTPVSYETVNKETTELAKGESRVVQEGIDGVITDVYEVVTVKGELVSEKLLTTKTTEATPEIIEHGVIETTTDKVETVVPYNTIYETDDTKYTDYEEVKQAGVTGLATETFTVTSANGEELSRVSNGVEVTTPVVDEVIVKGTKEIYTTETRTENEVIPYETITVQNDNKLVSESGIVTEGVAGQLQKVYTTSYEKGVKVGEELTGSNVVLAPINAVYEQGTINITYETETAPIYNSTKYVENPDVPKGTETVLVEGNYGELTYTYKVTTVGETSTRELDSTVITKKAVDKVIEIGTGVVREKYDIRTENDTAPQTFFENTYEFATGVFDVLQEGVYGYDTVTYLQHFDENGNFVSEEEVSRVVTPTKDLIYGIGMGYIGKSDDGLFHINDFMIVSSVEFDELHYIVNSGEYVLDSSYAPTVEQINAEILQDILSNDLTNKLNETRINNGSTYVNSSTDTASIDELVNLTFATDTLQAYDNYYLADQALKLAENEKPELFTDSTITNVVTKAVYNANGTVTVTLGLIR